MDIYFDDVSLANIDFGAYLREIVEGAIRHNLRVPSFTMFFKAIMTVEGIGKIISPNLDIVASRPYVERLVAERYSPQRVVKTQPTQSRHLLVLAKSSRLLLINFSSR